MKTKAEIQKMIDAILEEERGLEKRVVELQKAGDETEKASTLIVLSTLTMQRHTLTWVLDL